MTRPAALRFFSFSTSLRFWSASYWESFASSAVSAALISLTLTESSSVSSSSTIRRFCSSCSFLTEVLVNVVPRR